MNNNKSKWEVEQVKIIHLGRMGKQETTRCHSLYLCYQQLNPWIQEKRKKTKTSSCNLCRHMQEKRPSKNIFLSFQAISLIPDELQGREKYYGCGLAGGKEGILCHECASQCTHVCEHEFIWIYLHDWEDLFNDSFFFSFHFCLYSFVFEPMCICV